MIVRLIIGPDHICNKLDLVNPVSSTYVLHGLECGMYAELLRYDSFCYIFGR